MSDLFLQRQCDITTNHVRNVRKKKTTLFASFYTSYMSNNRVFLTFLGCGVEWLEGTLSHGKKTLKTKQGHLNIPNHGTRKCVMV